MDKITVSNTQPLTKENMWQAIDEIRSLRFGIVIGTYEETQFKIELIYWPLYKTLNFTHIIESSPELGVTKALVLARNFSELVELDGAINLSKY